MKQSFIPCRLFGTVIISLFTILASAQTDSVDLARMSLEDLLKIKIATNKEQVLEEAPSIVSVITRKEIAAYGCRDVSDVLRLVPGCEFGVDVCGQGGLLFRGIWTPEGKLLIMLNGVMINDPGYATYNFCGTLPPSIIDRVEVIRGPGSALYGGFAEVGVINIITVPSKKGNNVALSGNGGLVGSNGYTVDGNLFVTGSNEDLKYNINIGYAERPLSTKEYDDFFGNSVRLDNNTAFRKWHHFITEISYKRLTFNFHRTYFDFSGKDGNYIIGEDFLGQNQDIYNFSSNGTALRYDAKIGSKFTIIPQIEFLSGNSMTSSYSPLSQNGIYNMKEGQNMQRIKGQVTAGYNFGKAGELTIGAGYIKDIAKNTSALGTPGLFSPMGDTVFSVYTESKYILFQYVAKVRSFGFTAGTRYENTSFGEAFAPRIGVTFFKEKFNPKLLYGKAFRIPTPWQAYTRSFNAGLDLVAELTGTMEFEIGYKMNDIFKTRVNTYFINIDKPILYIGTANSYHNFGKIQSLGIEAELTAHYRKSRGFLNISYNKPRENTSESFVTSNKEYFLAVPKYTLNLGGFHEFGKLSIGSTFTWYSEKYGESQNHAQGLGGPDNTRYGSILLTNLNIVHKNLFKKVTVNLSVHNLFGQKYLLVQPSYGGHAPMPANDRQITLGAKLNL